MSWTNADGLTILMHEEQGEVVTGGRTNAGVHKTLVVELDLEDGVTDITGPTAPFIPAGAFLLRGTLVPTETAVGGTSADLGFVDADGSAIDDDGLVAAVTLAEWNAGHVLDGVDIGTIISASDNAYVTVSAVSGTFTAGKAKLVLEYIEV
jgi:hypothetical protein